MCGISGAYYSLSKPIWAEMATCGCLPNQTFPEFFYFYFLLLRMALAASGLIICSIVVPAVLKNTPSAILLHLHMLLG